MSEKKLLTFTVFVREYVKGRRVYEASYGAESILEESDYALGKKLGAISNINHRNGIQLCIWFSNEEGILTGGEEQENYYLYHRRPLIAEERSKVWEGVRYGVD